MPSYRKYKNVKTVIDGFRFDSKREANRYVELCLLQKAKLISDLELQRKFRIEVRGRHVCDWIADFCYLDNEDDGCMVCEDVKGVRTPVYKLKKKLMLAVYGIDIKEV